MDADRFPFVPPAPRGVDRRAFLGGAVAAGAAGALLPTWLAQVVGADTLAAPVAPTDGLLVVVTLDGGNDLLNTLVPRTGALRDRYFQLRGLVAVDAASVLPVTSDLGFHPALGRLADRYAQGDVALVQGVGAGAIDLSHFSSMATVMAGTASTARATGWLGRFLDELTEWESGLRGLAVGPTVPLHVRGARAKASAIPSGAAVWGADTSVLWDVPAYDALRAMASAPTGLGAWCDAVAAETAHGLDVAQAIGPVLQHDPLLQGLPADMAFAAGLLNADLGTRVVTTQLSGFDTHANQVKAHAECLTQLDAGLDTFFQVLRPEHASQTAVLVVSEFGRRAYVNSSFGTDHGSAGLALLVGDGVRGGLHGALPSLMVLDPTGGLVPTVDFRSVYATVLDRWLGADATAVLGGGYPLLDLFTAGPGA